MIRFRCNQKSIYEFSGGWWRYQCGDQISTVDIGRNNMVLARQVHRFTNDIVPAVIDFTNHTCSIRRALKPDMVANDNGIS